MTKTNKNDKLLCLIVRITLNLTSIGRDTYVNISTPKDGWGYNHLDFTVDGRRSYILITEVKNGLFLTVIATREVAELNYEVVDDDLPNKNDIAAFDEGVATGIIVSATVTHFTMEGWVLVSHSVMLLPNNEGPMCSFVFKKP